MFMTEYFDRREALEDALKQNINMQIALRNNPTSPEMHQLKRKHKELRKALKKLEDQYWK